MNEPCSQEPTKAWQTVATRRVAEHLRALSRRVAEVEDDLCENFDLHDRPGDPLIQSLQQLDYLRQSLEDVARLLDAMNTTGEAQSRHLEQLKMGATRALVQDDRPHSSPMPNTGKIDLF